MRNLLTILILSLTLSACAFGQKTSYDGRSDFNFQNNDNIKILVAVHDMRPYVQSRDKNPDFTGISKSIYGIPYSVTTKSGRPLADDFGQLIVNTMKYKNINAFQKTIPYSWTIEDFKNGILGKEKGIDIYYIQMYEWKTEVHFRGALHYNLKLFVFSDQGMEVANNIEKGFHYFDNNIPGKENLATSTSNILERLFAEKKATEITDAEKVPIQIIHADKQLPDEIKDKIRSKCAIDFPDDFEKQADCVKKQEAGWFELNQ